MYVYALLGIIGGDFMRGRVLCAACSFAMSDMWSAENECNDSTDLTRRTDHDQTLGIVF